VAPLATLSEGRGLLSGRILLFGLDRYVPKSDSVLLLTVFSS